MTYARDPGDTPEPPCFCGNQGGDWVLTTEEFCPACGDPNAFPPEPEDDSGDLDAGHLRDPEGDEAAHA